MPARTERRLAKIEAVVQTVPLPEVVVKLALDAFRSSGTLPDHDGLAAAVVERALMGNEPVELGMVGYCLGGSGWNASLPGLHEPIVAPPRETLFQEALSDERCVRLLARRALTALVARDANVMDPMWLQDTTIPEFGSFGLRLLGGPDSLAMPPYDAQTHRLIHRIADIRERAALELPHWPAALSAATREFLKHGALPTDELMRDAVIANAELRALMQHSVGQDVVAELVAFDSASLAFGGDREPTIAQLQELAVAGRLLGEVA
jgi:hypothetical protein